jgi:hypothetical protein
VHRKGRMPRPMMPSLTCSQDSPQHGGVGTGGEGLCGSLVPDDTTAEDLLSPISPALQIAPLPPSHSPLGKAKQMTGHFRLSSTRITREARSVRAFNGPGQNPLPDRFYSNLQIPSSLSRKADHQDTHQRSAIPRVQNGTPGCEQPLDDGEELTPSQPREIRHPCRSVVLPQMCNPSTGQQLPLWT